MYRKTQSGDDLVAPHSCCIRIGRHQELQVNERAGPLCTDNCIEHERHVLRKLVSALYAAYRSELYNVISNIEPGSFMFVTDCLIGIKTLSM